ncbi:histidine phosphatase family protein [Rhodococcus coprophilus]|uniref:Phosphoglycerate/bisphosphoglycerate mutase n=2 Tax=Rhodococcus coprophilus TaxID=38310 RepID=A0A2X4UK57_9NOCA|nr:histidine phosphatase family protein [Rhodococcus coprophilus]MBM7460301.1 2,3-bisphosphoglycerate-dependent phosphoglycerate mutase/probable phosphoglycerate mutase [Rhodococcus coprophilus]SQI38989.1 phosphoglycerate/bisphosphoglycerate mutase [Rhodococcus coprophilus]
MSEPRVRRLILLRHGQTGYNATRRMQGQLDTDLSDLGRRQAAGVAEAMAALDPRAVVSSDLRRAYDTAVAVADRAGLPVEIDARLRETHLGQWQGLTHTDVDAIAPGARSAWRADATWAPPEGESRVDVARRSLRVVDELLDKHERWGLEPIILVAHGGLIGALTAALLDLPVDRWPVLGGLGNTGWVQLSGYGDVPSWRLDVWNASAEVAPDDVL